MALWWLWHLSASLQLACIIGLLVVMVISQHQAVMAQRESVKAQQEAAFYARHAACGSLFLVASLNYNEPWAFWQQMTGQDPAVCQQDTK